MPHILILAGTQEARKLAASLAHAPNLRVTASLAGILADTSNLETPTRRGGFGGVDGLTAHLRRETVTAIVDATHPFAVRMQAHGRMAARKTGVPLCRLERPPWRPVAGDAWREAADIETALNLPPAGACVFAAIGGKRVERLTARPDCHFVVRGLTISDARPPANVTRLIAPPGQAVEDEIALFRRHQIDWILCRNSGGPTDAKLVAARTLGIPVAMIARPPTIIDDGSFAFVRVCHVEDALAWVMNLPSATPWR